MNSNHPSLYETEMIISKLLRYGVLACLFVIAVGLGTKLLNFGHPLTSSQETISQLLDGKILDHLQPARSLSEFKTGIESFNPDIIIGLGILLLISLPILRVGMTIVLFCIERDLIFSALAFFVLVVLIYGITSQ